MPMSAGAKHKALSKVMCKYFLGYTKNAYGEIEIVPKEAEIVREIYERYLSDERLYGIKCYLEEKEVPMPGGFAEWRQRTIRSILSNEKYKDDAIINKTYVSDCISKRVKVNNGERNKYYIENNYPAIMDAGTFARVQEEIARRSGKPKVKQKGTKTELIRYSSKYALSERLSAESAEHLTEDAHGRQRVKEKSYGKALMGRNTATTHRALKKACCKTPL